MVDFFGSFLIFIILVVLLIVVCIIYFIAKIIKRIIVDKKRADSERDILNFADQIIYYMENKNIDNIEELANLINAPKNMKISKENDLILIKYNNLTYNVNQGRFVITGLI